jgi:hypothetical protein
VRSNRIRSAVRALRGMLRGRTGFSAASYWESRYASGGNSGEGSYGKLGSFKADTINALLSEEKLASAIEFGCGDGNQLSLIRYARYTGLDVSASAIALCIQRFESDPTKSFFLYDPSAFRDSSNIFRCDVSLSLDVIYHIVSDDIFSLYMQHLCAAASKVLIVYSTDIEQTDSEHVRHRKFSHWIALNRPEFRLMRTIPNPYPGTEENQSDAAFYFYERVAGV